VLFLHKNNNKGGLKERKTKRLTAALLNSYPMRAFGSSDMARHQEKGMLLIEAKWKMAQLLDVPGARLHLR
jgi:hypothetical protein